jgi:hypothetical protein
MSPKDEKELQKFFTTFDVIGLGEGDRVAGLNLLAATAVTLANISRPGSGILTPGGRLIPVGCNLLASGPLVTSLVLDEVVTPVGRHQANLLAQLDRLLEDDAAEGAKSTPRQWTLSRATKPSPGEQALFRLATSSSDMPLFGTYEDEWASVVGDAPSQRFADLVRRPRCFVTATTPGQLVKQIAGAHLGQALVALGLNTTTDAASFADLCPALMDGLVPAGQSGEPVRGRLLVTAPYPLLREAAAARGDKTAWLERLIWLVDGSAGAEVPKLPSGDDSIVRLPLLTARFERASRLLLGNRLNSHEPQAVIDEYDFSRWQTRWMTFLGGMEKELPGIRGTARNLFATLVFGLGRLVGADDTPEGFRYSIPGIAAFAQHLICRMAAARASMLFSAEEAWKLHYKQKILERLERPDTDSPDTRAVYRGVHMDADPCRELLGELEAAGLVKLSGDGWQRIEGVVLPADPRN